MSPDLLAGLPIPASYFPLHRERFEVSPGLVPLSTSFGNGTMDNRLFQIDRAFPSFRANTLAARAENRDKYVLLDKRFDTVAPTVNRLLIERLTVEYPDYFIHTPLSQGASILHCRLTEEELHFDAAMHLYDVKAIVPPIPAYPNSFDALLSQVPEDMAVVYLPRDGSPDANIALHITAPSHWIPSEKIGASFLQTHAPVPHFERVARASDALMRNMLTRPPFVRFNWGIEFTDRWNLHPIPPPNADPLEWNRRTPNSLQNDSLYLRLERQTLWGLGEIDTLLFAIRIHTQPIADLLPTQREALLQTLLSMPPESRDYKSLPPETFAAVCDRLALLPETGIISS